MPVSVSFCLAENMKNKRVILCVLICLLICLGCFPAEAEGDCVRQTLGFWGVDAMEALSSFSEETLAETGSWLILALREYDGSADYAALGERLEASVKKGIAGRNPVGDRRLALTLAVCGRENALVTADCFGGGEKGGIMSMVFTLHLLNNGLAAEPLCAVEYARKLIERQEEDGGWATIAHLSDVDTTAMVLSALAPLDGDAEVKNAVERGVDFLVKSRLEDGGFCAFGVENAESTAQVLVAMGCLGEDVFPEGWRASLVEELLSYRTGNGYAHVRGGEVSEMATVQALCAFISLDRMDKGLGSMFCFDPAVLPSDGGGKAAEAPTAPAGESHLRLWLCLGTILAGCLACVVLYLCGKRNPGNFAAVGVCVLAVCLLICFVKISSVSEHGRQKDKPNAVGSVTVSIVCDEAMERAPILPPEDFLIEEGDTVYDILIEASVRGGFTVDSQKSGGAYIRGIADLYQFDRGPLSGWTYTVNGISPSVGCDTYRLSPGDVVEWIYTLEGNFGK